MTHAQAEEIAKWAETFSNFTEEQVKSITRVPYSISRNKQLTRKQKDILSVVFTYSPTEKHPFMRCHLTQKQLAEHPHINSCVNTVNRAIKRFGEIFGDAFTVTDHDDAGRRILAHSYTYRINGDDGYIACDDAVSDYIFPFYDEDNTVKERRKLTRDERTLYFRIASICSTRKVYYGKPSSLASGEGISLKRTRRALKGLYEARLVFRVKRAVNGYDEGEYAVSFQTLRRAKKAQKNERKGDGTRTFISPERYDAEARADFERYYSRLRFAAEDAANERKKRLYEFSEAYRNFGNGDFLLAKAEYSGDDELVGKLKARQGELKKQIAADMRTLGITTLEPIWYCPKCEDTGFNRKTGKQCDCYSPPEKPSGGKHVKK